MRTESFTGSVRTAVVMLPPPGTIARRNSSWTLLSNCGASVAYSSVGYHSLSDNFETGAGPHGPAMSHDSRKPDRTTVQSGGLWPPSRPARNPLGSPPSVRSPAASVRVFDAEVHELRFLEP